MLEIILSLCIGIGLSAVCGFRVFVPLLVMSIASLMGWFEPAKDFEWLAMPLVGMGLAVATICEIAAALILVGGTAGTVQLSTATVRGLSTVTTGGIANPLVSTGEWLSAILISIFALIVPVLVVILGIIIMILIMRWVRTKKTSMQHPNL